MKIKFFFIFILFFSKSEAQNIKQTYSPEFSHFLDSVNILIDYRWGPVKKALSPSLINESIDFVSNNSTDRKSHFLLMMLSEKHPDIYQSINDSIKVIAFCSRFSQAIKMNYWSILKPNASRYSDFTAAHLFVGLGEKILPCLQHCLSDTTRVEFGWNTESRSYYIQYKWRKKDFAHRYAALVLGEKPIFLETPEERDKIIDDFIKRNGSKFIKKD
jgi:hypothetical protein